MSKKKADTAPYDTEGRLRALADGLAEAFESISSGLHGDGEHPSVVADLARIGTALTSALAELRQHSKASQRAIESLPIEAVIAHLKTFDVDRRRHISRELLDQDAEGPVL